MNDDLFGTSLADELAGHAARNEDLGRTLAQRYKVRLDVPRNVDLFFWSLSAAAAERLIVALRAAGLPGAEATETGEDHLPWSVQVSLVIPPTEVLAAPFTERLAVLARECESQYDGWGTQAEPSTPTS